MAATLLTFLVSCQDRGSVAPIEKSLTDLREFRDDLFHREQFPLEEVPSTLTSLHRLEDSVLIHISGPDDKGNAVILSQVTAIGGEIIVLINQTIDARERDYDDFLLLQAKLADPFGPGPDAKLAYSFFQSLDSAAIPAVSVKQAEEDYIGFLACSAGCDYPTWNSVLEFLTTEDYYFRLYLNGYLDHSASGSREIIEVTNAVMGRLVEMADAGHYGLEQLQTYLSVRTGRRLILNAEVCLSLIDAGSVKSLQEASSALSGALSPYTTFNKKMVEVRTDGQVHELLNIGKRLPMAVSKLSHMGYDAVIPPDSIPNILMKDYVSFYHSN